RRGACAAGGSSASRSGRGAAGCRSGRSRDKLLANSGQLPSVIRGTMVIVTVEATTERVLRLLALLQRRPSWTAAELAAELGVTGRGVRRDAERLRALGSPVQATGGVGGGYQLGAGPRLPPLLLADEEASATAVSLRMASGGTVAGAGEAALRALAKLDQVMPPRLRAEVRAVHGAAEPLLGPGVETG